MLCTLTFLAGIIESTEIKNFVSYIPKVPFFLYLADSESRACPFIQLNVTSICLFIFLMCVTVYMYVLVGREETGVFKRRTVQQISYLVRPAKAYELLTGLLVQC